MNHQDFPFDVKSFSDEKTDVTQFEGFASTFGNQDLVGDVIARGAFTKSLRNRKMPSLLWQHQRNNPIGVFTDIKETDKGLFVKGRLSKGVQQADEAAILLKDGAIQAMSIGFQVIDSERSGDATLLKEIDLWEASLVTFPANPEAQITSVKAAVVPFQDFPVLMKNGKPDTNQTWSATDAINRVREFTNSQNSPSSEYKKFFLYYDPDNADNFTAYKLPYVDIINGKAVVIPRALFAAASATSGGRGGFIASAADKSKIKTNIDKYYSKMDLPSPFDKNMNLIVDIKRAKLIHCKRDIENLLRDSGVFSKEASIYLASKFQTLQSESGLGQAELKLLDDFKAFRTTRKSRLS